jgi:hypothetical protein
MDSFAASYAIAAQVCQATIGKLSSKRHNNVTYVCKELILPFIPQVKNKPKSQREL